MAILMMENFRDYPAYNDMLVDGGRGGPWTTFEKISTGSQQSLIENTTWRGDGSSLRAVLNENFSDRSAPQRDFTATPVKSVCAQVICGSTGGSKTFTEACNFVLFQEPVVYKDTVSTGVLNAFYGISIRSTSVDVGTADRVGVYYTIMTSASGAVNSVLIGYLKPWTRDRHYHVELKVDHTNPLARIIVYVNGVLEMDATYNRDRVDSGFQTKDFKRIMLGGYTSVGNNRSPTYSNLVVYTDEAGTDFPMGPIDVITVSPTPGQGYDGLRANPNADDSTYVTLLPGGNLNGTFGDLAASPNPVLAVDATVRHGSMSGIEPSQLTTRILRGDGSVLGEIMTTAAPGVPATHRRVRLPAGTTLEDVNGATFSMAAAG